MKKMFIFLVILALAIIVVCCADVFIKHFLESSFSGSCLSLTFDDGYKSHYSVVRPLLKEKEFDATFFVFTHPYKNNQDGSVDGYMTMSEVKALVDEGYEIGSHTLTHPNLKTIIRGQLVSELSDSKTILEKDFDTNVFSFAFPFSKYSKNMVNLGKEHYEVVRNLYPKSFFIQTHLLNYNSDYDEVCKLISQAKRRNLWLVLVFHDIKDSPGIWDSSKENFIKVLDCAKRSEITVDSLHDCKVRLFD